MKYEEPSILEQDYVRYIAWCEEHGFHPEGQQYVPPAEEYRIELSELTSNLSFYAYWYQRRRTV